jgi:hypothetical protein
MNTALILHLLGVGVLYLSFGSGLFGLVNFIKPIARLKIRSRWTAAKICGIAILLLIVARCGEEACGIELRLALPNGGLR